MHYLNNNLCLCFGEVLNNPSERSYYLVKPNGYNGFFNEI